MKGVYSLAGLLQKIQLSRKQSGENYWNHFLGFVLNCQRPDGLYEMDQERFWSPLQGGPVRDAVCGVPADVQSQVRRSERGFRRTSKSLFTRYLWVMWPKKKKT
ncbi:hypothetical protein AMECASPLE_023294 [Ameca splendens]|uniref:Uncharacterized protein n=1 Tax=Ameca splendens TaxID=208324 RepID=A0ABV1ABI9_9TELE